MDMDGTNKLADTRSGMRKDRAVGWRAVRRDWAHFVRVRGETGAAAYLRVFWENPSLWSLWVYRYGHWVYHRCPRLLAVPHRPLYKTLNCLVELLFKNALNAQATIGSDVWLAPCGSIRVGIRSNVGSGSYLHGYNTLGFVDDSDVLPRLGERVHVGPGTMLVGPVEVPNDTIIGANSVVVRSIPSSGAWNGAPARPFDGPPERLIPSSRTADGARRSGRI